MQTNQQGGVQQERIVWLDYARMVAIVSITINHALSRSFQTHVDTLSEFQEMSIVGSYIKALLYVISRLGVPVFLMISGSLLLKRNYEDKTVLDKFLRNNWWPLLRTTLIWLTIMYIYLSFGHRSFIRTEGILSGISHYIETILFVNHSDIVTMGSIWYMPMILCIYLIIPVISIAIKRIDNRYIIYLCLLVTLSSTIVPNINTILDALNIQYSIHFELSYVNIFSMYLVYVIIGYWIFNGIFNTQWGQVLLKYYKRINSY